MTTESFSLKEATLVVESTLSFFLVFTVFAPFWIYTNMYTGLGAYSSTLLITMSNWNFVEAKADFVDAI